MTDDQLKSYRAILEKEFVDKDLEIDTTLSYISIGALGFFLTINEKFVSIYDSNSKILLILSLVSLLTAFIIVLYRKSKTIDFDLKLMDLVDNMKSGNEDDDIILLDNWKLGHTSLKRIRRWIYYTLGFGIICQVIFVIINIIQV